ncbi:MAG: CrcB family protein [Pirellulaceae bacterium]|nr:CrcB family protein [Pirellulaceae bacterium]
MAYKLILLAVAGAAGTLARYGLGGLVQNHCEKLFPWGTVAVNLSGCLAFGLIWTALEQRWPVGGETRAIVLVGFLGAFTTFSTFIFETEELLHVGQWLPAIGYFTLHNVGGLAAMAVGMIVGRFF